MADDTSWDDEFPERDGWHAHHDGPGSGLDAFDVFLPADDPVDQGSLTFDESHHFRLSAGDTRVDNVFQPL